MQLYGTWRPCNYFFRCVNRTRESLLSRIYWTNSQWFKAFYYAFCCVCNGACIFGSLHLITIAYTTSNGGNTVSYLVFITGLPQYTYVLDLANGVRIIVPVSVYIYIFKSIDLITVLRDVKPWTFNKNSKTVLSAQVPFCY